MPQMMEGYWGSGFEIKREMSLKKYIPTIQSVTKLEQFDKCQAEKKLLMVLYEK